MFHQRCFYSTSAGNATADYDMPGIRPHFKVSYVRIKLSVGHIFLCIVYTDDIQHMCVLSS